MAHLKKVFLILANLGQIDLIYNQCDQMIE